MHTSFRRNHESHISCGYCCFFCFLVASPTVRIVKTRQLVGAAVLYTWFKFKNEETKKESLRKKERKKEGRKERNK
eukprot:m.170356 g.170356  ORF g.170356 m.170356 type:complete len:76 (+) comp15337_c0_seq7:201-428(+)